MKSMYGIRITRATGPQAGTWIDYVFDAPLAKAAIATAIGKANKDNIFQGTAQIVSINSTVFKRGKIVRFGKPTDVPKAPLLIELNRTTAGTIFNGYVAQNVKAMEVAPTVLDAAQLALKFISEGGDKMIVDWNQFLQREGSYLVAERR